MINSPSEIDDLICLVAADAESVVSYLPWNKLASNRMTTYGMLIISKLKNLLSDGVTVVRKYQTKKYEVSAKI